MKATFENSVNVLVKAYLNNTLHHSNCRACAVGNLIQASGYNFDKHRNDAHQWLVMIDAKVRKESYHHSYNEKIAMAQIESTGYSMEELEQIERSFERNFQFEYTDQEMFIGLMNVIDVLAEIHNIDLTAKESAKKLFVKP